jgi:hypothetical protein
MIGEITKQDIQALRLASTVSFHSNGDAKIVATKEPNWKDKEKNPFAQDVRYEVPVDYCFEGPKGSGFKVAFEMIGCAQSSMTWQSIVSILHPNDALKLCWYPDAGTSALLEHAIGDGKRYYPDEPHSADFTGLHCDHLYLEIKRGKKTLRFLVDTATTTDNSARMVRRHAGAF